ncbi:MAG: cytochrome c, partial [Hydrogenophaga sp.]
MKFTLLKGALSVMLLAGATLVGAVAWEMRGEALPMARPLAAARSAEVERGAYLARAGNCMACHTARGGESYAGGRAID